MNSERIRSVLIIFLFLAITAAGAYTTYPHSAVRIADGKDSDLMGTLLGNGRLKDVWCDSNCSGFSNISGNGSNLNLSGNLTAKKIGGVIYANQYATIQDSINQTINNGGTVHIGIGIYNTTPLTLYNGTILEGEGNRTTLRLSDGAWAAASALQQEGFIQPIGLKSAEPYTTTYDIQIRNIRIDANRQGQVGITANKLYGLQMIWVKNLRIENVEVTNAYSSGLGVWPSRGTVPYNIYNTDGENIINGVMAINNGVGAQALDAGIFISCCGDWNATQRTVLSNSFAINNTPNGVMIEDTNDVTISNVGAYNNSNYGFGLQSVQNIQFSGITAKNNSIGIGSTAAIGEKWVSITGSNFEQNRVYGIEYRGHDWTVTGNKITHNGASGVWSDGFGLSFSSNTVNGNGKNISAPNRAGVFLMNNPYNGNKIIGNTIGRNPIVDTDETQQYGIQEAEPITIGAGTISRNQYSLNSLDYNFISGLLKNTSSTGSISFQNTPISGFAFGSFLSAPTNNFGAGDTYFNSTKNSMCVYTTSWVFIGNSTGAC